MKKSSFSVFQNLKRGHFHKKNPILRNPSDFIPRGHGAVYGHCPTSCAMEREASCASDGDGEAKTRGTSVLGTGRNSLVARAFWAATTRHSSNTEDILPQEGGNDGDHSVFHVFALAFPDIVGANGAGFRNKIGRLHFNKIGYKMYAKQQSRRVPSRNAKPGMMGYGFRCAQWRDTLNSEQDRVHMEKVLRSVSCADEQIERVKKAVQECRERWKMVRRPTRQAGPGRPRNTPVCEDSCPRISDGEESDLSPYASGVKRRANAMAALGNMSQCQLSWSRADIAGSKRASTEGSGGTLPSSDPHFHTVAVSPFLQPSSGAASFLSGFTLSSKFQLIPCAGQAGYSPFTFFAAAGSGASAWSPFAFPGQEGQNRHK